MPAANWSVSSVKPGRSTETDDVDELRKKLEQMKRDNEEKRRAYQADLDRIETELADIETKYDASSSAGETP